MERTRKNPVAARRAVRAVAIACAAGLGFAATSPGQAAAPWLMLPGPGYGYVEVPHDPALNPGAAITVEAWVHFTGQVGTNGSSCPSIVGKRYTEAYWLGMCSQHMRFYVRGSGSARDSLGAIPLNQWVHIAATYDGTATRFYINGTLDSEYTLSEGGPPTPSEAPLRIGSDSAFNYTPPGAIDEVRLWSVARSESDIAATMHAPLDTPQAGLVGVWHLDGDAQDAVGGHDGELVGAGLFGSTIPINCTYEFAVPAAGHLPGDLGSQWVTDLVLMNTTGFTATAVIYLLPRDSDNTDPVSVSYDIPGNASLALDDVILSAFGESNLAAAVRICSSLNLVVFSRTFNQGGSGTYGQGIPGRSRSEVKDDGDTAFLAGLHETAAFRTNVGFTNLSDEASTVTVYFYDANGTLLGTREYEIPPYGHIQRNRVFTEVTSDPVANGVVKVYIDGGRLLIYASIIDAVTNDPTFFYAK